MAVGRPDGRTVGRSLGIGIVVALLAATLGSGVARAQSLPSGTRIPVQAGATIDRDSVTVGDVVTLTVRVRAPRGATINFPVAVDSLGPVQSLQAPVVRDGADTLDYSDRIATYRLAPWDVGSLPIRLGDVLVQTDDDERRVALPLPSLFVKSVLPADSALRVPKPARDLIAPPTPWPWWWWIAALAAAIAIGILIWWLRRRRAEPGPTGDPYADAEAAFDRVEKLRLPEAGEPGRHTALMTDVARRYMADRFTTAPLALTSRELLAALRGMPTVPHDRLEALFTRVDPVKFGAAPLRADDARTLGNEARAIVRAEHERAAQIAAAAATSRTQGAAA